MMVSPVLERVVLIATSLAAVLSLFDAPQAATVAVVVAAVIGIVRIAANPARWPMMPAYLAVAWLSVELAVSLPGHARVAGAVVALLLVALAAGLTAGLPIPRLPRPDGPFGVGTIVTAEERPAPAGAPGEPRRLFVKVWYPADGKPARRSEGEALWSEFREAPGIPVGLRLLTGYLREVRTYAVRGALASPVAVRGPVVVYHHGLISISAENSLLMESLASHGHVVVSIRHIDQQGELDAVNALADPAAAARVQEITRELLRGEHSRAERSRLSQELFQLSTGLATIVGRRTADSRHVLDRLPTILSAIPGYPAGALAPVERVAAVGLSLGGAVASELSKTDDRCAVAVNLDGGLYGEHLQEPLTVPYLMIYSGLNSGGNDAARDAARAEFQEATAPAAKHLDFHDASIVLPILRWFGQLGRVSGTEINTWKNDQVRHFLDQHIRAADSATS